ncbi:hypothetical protein BX600DRAFT_453653 [Xylariales sp. PMI_506]|nr:hypothetical protein BX600DRAFT_453653 [Xylariales sp. PMI_506]
MLSCIGRGAVQRLAGPVSAVATTSSRSLLAARLAIRVAPRQPNLFTAARFFTTSDNLGKEAPKPRKKNAGPKKAGKAKPASAKRAKKIVKKAAKPKSKKVKKPKSDATKAREQKQRDVVRKKELVEIALFTEPKALPEQPWTTYLSEQLKGSSGPVTAQISSVAQTFKQLSLSEAQKYQGRAEQNKQQNAAAYQSWVESYTPQQISDANRARNTLSTKFNLKKASRSIKDHRQPKKPTGAFAYFNKERWATGNFADRELADAARSISQEWKALSEAEKEPYFRLASADAERYAKDFEKVFQRPLHEDKPKNADK